MSVEQILGESQFSNVRALADELRMFKIRESHGGEHLAYTADVSLTSSRSGHRSSMPSDWEVNNGNCVENSDVFMPSDRVKDFLQKEEQLWADEYGSLPANPNFLTAESAAKKPSELLEFSRYRLAVE